MKKIFVGTILAITSLFALPKGKYVCIPTLIIDNKSGIEYKLTKKEMTDSVISFTLQDRYLNDGSTRYNYFATKSGIDYYKNIKSNYILGLSESLDEDNMVGAVLISNSKSMVFGCKYIGK